MLWSLSIKLAEIAITCDENYHRWLGVTASKLKGILLMLLSDEIGIWGSNF
jgi:hypothetical protein